jgi:hypothetical protein
MVAGGGHGLTVTVTVTVTVGTVTVAVTGRACLVNRHGEPLPTVRRSYESLIMTRFPELPTWFRRRRRSRLRLRVEAS